jgi:methionyl-tRNA formyltransferase (EC 2.1.2.9)
MRIVFMGTPEFAVPSLESLLRSPHDVVGVVTQPDRPKGRGQEVVASPVKLVAQRARIPILQPLKMKDPGFGPRCRPGSRR